MKHRVSGTPSNGCHDVTVLLAKELAAAACLQETQLWDIADPVNPKVLTSFKNPQINFDHSTAFSHDGRTLVVGDEFGGAAAPHSCATTAQPAKFGALWFYDITDPTKPVEKGSFQLEPQGPLALCTAHMFNVVPLRGDRDLLVSAFYEGGTTLVDFTDPAKPVKLGGYIPKTPNSADTWASYWYNGFIYSNNHEGTPASRGFDVMRVDDPAVAGALTLERLNPQTQEPLHADAGGAGGTDGTAAGGTGGASSSGSAGVAGVSATGPAACQPIAGFARARTSPRPRGGLLFDVVRRSRSPYTVEVFQESTGRRVLPERLVARFSGREGPFRWNGRANRPGRRVRSGHYFARLSVPIEGTRRRDFRRVTLERRGGRFVVRPDFYRRLECGPVSAFRTERPVFGGTTGRPLDISFLLRRAGRVEVTITRRGKVVRRFASRHRRADRTYRLRFAAAGAARGDYQVRLVARIGGRVVRSTVTAKRL